MDYEDEMKISIKEIIEDLNSRIESTEKGIAYYTELIELKKKHCKSTLTEDDILSALKTEKITTENIKSNIKDILYANDIPEEYYKIKEEE